jgi:predicted DNA-binding protein YlxM (UPF0122 family)
MTKEEINTALEEFNKQEMSKDLMQKGKPLLESYQAAVAQTIHEQKEKFVADGGLPEDFKLEREEHDVRFDELWAQFSKLKKEFKEKLANAENDNLSIKEALLAKIEALKSEEHIKHAHEVFKEIESKWKSTGRIPQDKVKDLDASYSRARDEFFYNMHIYRELLENDLKKNLQLKEAVVVKMKEALNLKSFKDMDLTARRLTDEWNDIGPTYKEKWEEIRDQFWEAHHNIFNKIKDFYKSQKEKQKENFEKKKDLVARLKEISSFNITSDKSWKKHTAIVLGFQKEWRAIGFAPKADNDKIWGEFKTAADDFFGAKSEFYKTIKEGYDKNKAEKEKLVTKAEQLIHSEDHRGTANMLTDLQKQWRKIGSAHHRDEQRLWKKFRSACNAFFENRKTQQKQDTINQKENLAQKNVVIEKIKALKPNSDKPLSEIDVLITEFNKIGFVPMSDKQKIAVDYKNAIHQKLSEFGIAEAELSDYLFNVKINELAESQFPEKALEKEAQHIREKIRTIKANILQYENNLGFFKHSKGANALKEEVEQKIESNKQILSKLESKLELVYENL